MPQSERWRSIGREILFSARTELYMGLPFLDAALGALAVADEGYDTDTLATDAKALYYNGPWLARQLERTRTGVNRAYLHTVFHCLLRHPAKSKHRDTPLWDLACDIAVESMLDSLDYRCVQADKPSVRRQNTYRRLRKKHAVLTAEAVYRQFQRERLNSYDCATLARVFYVDDHTLWPTSDDGEQDQQWQRAAQRTQTAMETMFSDQAAGGEAVREQLSVAAYPTTDYRAFLRRFAAPARGGRGGRGLVRLRLLCLRPAALRQHAADRAARDARGAQDRGFRHRDRHLDVHLGRAGAAVFVLYLFAFEGQRELFPPYQSAHSAVRRPAPLGQAHHKRTRPARLYGPL